MKTFKEYEDLVKAEKDPFYFRNAPVGCDICGSLFWTGQYMADCSLDFGGAGCVCEQCFYDHGIGIGYGVGQLYLKQADGKWLLVGGAPPDLC